MRTHQTCGRKVATHERIAAHDPNDAPEAGSIHVMDAKADPLKPSWRRRTAAAPALAITQDPEGCGSVGA